jgi:hypothetical protein
MSKEDMRAKRFTRDMFDHHGALLKNGDIEIRDAVIVKAVALLALAFDIPPTSEDENVDVDATIEKLRHAMNVLARKKMTASHIVGS